MGYSNYKKLRQVTQKFGLDAQIIDLFADILRVSPSDWLEKSLDFATTMPLTNEKNKSERLVSPILLEVAMAFKDKITLFSGEEININANDDLSGPCDFFFALHPPKPYLDVPIISLTEAKDEDLDWGVAQCSAQMYAAFLFNQQQGKHIPVLYGCATTGIEWQFIRFENNTFSIDRKPITDLKEVLGIWHWIIRYFINTYIVNK